MNQHGNSLPRKPRRAPSLPVSVHPGALSALQKCVFPFRALHLLNLAPLPTDHFCLYYLGNLRQNLLPPWTSVLKIMKTGALGPLAQCPPDPAQHMETTSFKLSNATVVVTPLHG